MNGATVFQMVSGLGDAFGSAYSDARKQAQEEEAPTLISNLMNAYKGGGASAVPAVPGAGAAAAPAQSGPVAAAPTFAATGGGMGDYLATTRAKESGGNDLAANPNSTALGRYQFTKDTWAGLAKKYPDLGLTPNGRTDPDQQERAMQAFTRDNAQALTAAGITINPQNLYGAHFLGAGGASRFIPGALSNPDAPATSLVGPGVASANRTVFFNRDGSPKTAGEVYAWMGGRRGGTAPASTQAAAAPQIAPPQRSSVAVAENEADVQALEREMGMLPSVPRQVASAEPDAANIPAAGAQPVGFVVPQGGAASATPSQSFPGFAASASTRMTPELQTALNAAWRNPNTRAMAGQIFGQLLKGGDTPWELKDVNGQSAWVNGRTGQILPIGQAKRNTATVGNNLVDTATGEVLYTAQEKPTTVSPGSALVGSDGRVIYQAPNAENTKLTTVAPGNVVFDPVTRQPVYSAPSTDSSKPVSLSPGATLVSPEGKPLYQAPDRDKSNEGEAKLRGEFTKQLGTFSDVQDGYRRLIAATEQREANPGSVSPASDIALIFGYMKMLDPGSVVREGEYATAQNAASVPDRVRNAYNKALQGEFLTDGQRQDFVDTAGRLYGQAYQQAEQTGTRYRDLARGQGLDEGRVVAIPDRLVAPKIGRKPPPNGKASEAGAKANSGPVSIPMDAVRDLRALPDTPQTRAQFDAVFGEGAAARVIGPAGRRTQKTTLDDVLVGP
ncbi:hypothetical protein PUR23_01200 [Methylorubrum populi]|uniref:hypothetical protein n=1 Tax=Methylorubrum populi TaxID=223967 RepID=UPI0031F88CC6